MAVALKRKIGRLGLSAFAVCISAQAAAQTQAQSTDAQGQHDVPDDIIVTANKRSESLQKVGLTVQVLGGETLSRQGIDSLSDIAQAVPGLTFARTANNTPVLTLRGVGFFDSTLASYPDVSLYIDQTPLPFPTTATLAAFDLERIEVLKGPQGTLFGNNATGGAINYIAAKPQSRLAAGGELTYARFGQVEAAGYVTGPLSSTLNARLAVKTTQGGNWQRNYVRDDRLGEANALAGRLLLEWKPTNRLTVNINLNGWRDRSDPQAPQYTFYRPQNAAVPANFPIGLYPRSPADPRAADWSTGAFRPRADNRLLQAAGRVDYDITDTARLTSITSYIDYSHDQVLEGDGTVFRSLDVPNTGKINSFSQELRLSGQNVDRVRWVVGANYERSDVTERNMVEFVDSTGAVPAIFERSGNSAIQKIRTYAGFANIEFDVTDQLTLKGGIRQTRVERRSANASFLTDQVSIPFFVGLLNVYRAFILGNPTPLSINAAVGDPLSADPTTGVPGLYRGELNEDSTSWSIGANFKATNDVLLYANVSKGYKAGGFPALSAVFWNQFFPVVQEELLSYEAGFKTQLMDRRLTLNGAAFYYDYKNKQLRAKLIDPLFGLNDGLVNVPKSRIKGAEIELVATPVEGLSLNAGATYLDAKVDEYTGIVGAQVNPATGLQEAVRASLAGSDLPLAPRWQINGGVTYDFPLTSSLKGTVGANASYQSSSTSVLVGGPSASDFNIDAYTVVNARVGISRADDAWRVSFWAKNMFNQYYWTNALATSDTVVRYAGRPAEYGVTFGVKF